MKTHFSWIVIAVCMAALVVSSAAAVPGTVDDYWDAWENARKMQEMVEMGPGGKAGAQRAGHDAVASLEKAISKQGDSGKKDKLIDAKSAISKALTHVGEEQWPNAQSEVKKAVELIEAAKP